MATTYTPRTPQQHRMRDPRVGRDASYQAYAVLRGAFTIAPIVFGLDKFTNLLVHWDRYLAPVLSDPLPVSPHQAMYAVGVVEVIAGLVVLLHPRLGGLVVAAWLAGIIANLLLIPGYYDVALRDFGLLLAAVALQRLATMYDARPVLWPLRRPATEPASAEAAAEGGLGAPGAVGGAAVGGAAVGGEGATPQHGGAA
ncbi:hypothetical protein GCM10027517_33420 [Phycicoccus ginsengisoli]